MLDRLPEGGSEERIMAEGARVQVLVAQGHVPDAAAAFQTLEAGLADHAELTARAQNAVDLARGAVLQRNNQRSAAQGE